MEIIPFIVLVCLIACSMLSDKHFEKKANELSYDEFLAHCKELIDEEKYFKLRNYIYRHPKQVLLNYNELIPLLTDYARKKFGNEIDKSNKEVN